MMPNTEQQAAQKRKARFILIACTVIYGYFLVPAIFFAFELAGAIGHPSFAAARPLPEVLTVKFLLSFLAAFPLLLLVSIVGGWTLYAAKRIRTALSLQLLPAPVVVFGICLLLIQELPWRIHSPALLFPRSAADYQQIGNVHFIQQEYSKAVLDFTKAVELSEPGSQEYISAHTNRARAQTARKNFGSMPEFYLPTFLR